MMDNEKSQEHVLPGRLAQPGRLRDSMLELWKRTRIDWSFVTGELSATLRTRGHLGSDERRMLAETLFGMIRHLRRLETALAAGGLRAADRAPDVEMLLAYLVLEAGLPPDQAARQCPAVDWQAVAGVDARIAREPDMTRRIARQCSLPDWLAAGLVADFGDRAPALAAALGERAPMTVRVNTLAASRDDLASWLAEEGLQTMPGPYAPTALRVESRRNLFALSAFQRGAFELQDEGSQLLALLVAPPPRSLVVDYCAGAGGKTLALAAAMGNRGRIVATDTDARKLRELRRRTRRAGVTNVQAMPLPADGAWPAALARLEGAADRVLVDAPCTGIGSLRRHPELRWRLSPADLARFPVRQIAICEQALSLVRPGGRLVYATCTLLRAENQDVIERVLAAHPAFTLVPAVDVLSQVLGNSPERTELGRDLEIARELCDASGTFLSVAPDRHGTDGFFAAVLQRKP